MFLKGNVEEYYNLHILNLEITQNLQLCFKFVYAPNVYKKLKVLIAWITAINLVSFISTNDK